MNELTERNLMIHVEKAVRPLRMTQSRRGKLREQLFSRLRDIYEQELEACDDRRKAFDAAINRFGLADDIARKLRDELPWYSTALSYVPWFARVRSWPESTWRIAWRGWMTGILFWVGVGVPWCYALFLMGRYTAVELVGLWLLLAAWGIVFLVSFVGMVGSIHGVYGQCSSTRRAVGWAAAGCLGQLVVYGLLHLYVNPTMTLAVYAVAFVAPTVVLAASRTRGFTKLIGRDEERSERTGQWEQLVLDATWF